MDLMGSAWIGWRAWAQRPDAMAIIGRALAMLPGRLL